MKKTLSPLSLKNVRTYSIRKRKSLVHIEDFSRPFRPGSSFAEFLQTLPGFLAAKDFRRVVEKIVRAHRQSKPVILAMGAHPLKVGLSPLIVHWMEQGILSALAMNGAGIIHDFEIAFHGQTSEDVASEIGRGAFGMAEETGRRLNEAILQGGKKGWGIGRSVGEMILRKKLPHRRLSVTATAARLGIPLTVHVALGTDIIHMHPCARGDAIGEGSHRDFLLFAGLISRLQGGVYLNLGSAVILPEVFLKALTLARNLGYRVNRFTAVNMDFIAHYRPLTNVIRRPTQSGGEGFHFTGHHELMFPLLAAAVLEALSRT